MRALQKVENGEEKHGNGKSSRRAIKMTKRCYQEGGKSSKFIKITKSRKRSWRIG